MPYGLKRKRRYVWHEDCGSDKDWHKMKRTERQQAKIEVRKEIEENKGSD